VVAAVKSEQKIRPTDDVGGESDVDSEIESDFDAASEQPSIESDIEDAASGGDDDNGMTRFHLDVFLTTLSCSHGCSDDYEDDFDDKSMSVVSEKASKNTPRFSTGKTLQQSASVSIAEKSMKVQGNTPCAPRPVCACVCFETNPSTPRSRMTTDICSLFLFFLDPLCSLWLRLSRLMTTTFNGQLLRVRCLVHKVNQHP
jgi:hypothetical protein